MTSKPTHIHQLFECHEAHSGHAMVRVSHQLTKINVHWLKKWQK